MGPAGLGWQHFEITGFPGEDTLEGGLTAQVSRFGVNQFTVLNPNLTAKHAVGDTQHGRTLRDAFQLDDVHEALALHPAEAPLGFAPD